MPDIRQQLIDLYGRHKADEVGNDPAFQDLCKENEEDLAFDGVRHRIEEMKRNLEAMVGAQRAYQDQVKWSLKVINQTPVGAEREETVELVRQAYSNKWRNAQKQYFEDGCKMLETWRDFFLSFTSRNPTREHVNAINANHRHFIEDVIPGTYENSDVKNANLLAEALYYLLRNRQLRGFYYPKHEQDNQVVEDKLREGCRNTFSFVQLIQNQMFVTYPNYCHFEYEQVTGNPPVIGDRKLVFVLGESYEDLIRDYNVHIRLRRWYKDVETRAAVKIQYTRRANLDIIDQNYDSIKVNVLQKVEEAKATLFDNVPA